MEGKSMVEMKQVDSKYSADYFASVKVDPLDKRCFVCGLSGHEIKRLKKEQQIVNWLIPSKDNPICNSCQENAIAKQSLLSGDNNNNQPNNQSTMKEGEERITHPLAQIPKCDICKVDMPGFNINRVCQFQKDLGVNWCSDTCRVMARKNKWPYYRDANTKNKDALGKSCFHLPKVKGWDDIWKNKEYMNNMDQIVSFHQNRSGSGARWNNEVYISTSSINNEDGMYYHAGRMLLHDSTQGSWNMIPINFCPFCGEHLSDEKIIVGDPLQKAVLDKVIISNNNNSPVPSVSQLKQSDDKDHCRSCGNILDPTWKGKDCEKCVKKWEEALLVWHTKNKSDFFKVPQVAETYIMQVYPKIVKHRKETNVCIHCGTNPPNEKEDVCQHCNLLIKSKMDEEKKRHHEICNGEMCEDDLCKLRRHMEKCPGDSCENKDCLKRRLRDKEEMKLRIPAKATEKDKGKKGKVFGGDLTVEKAPWTSKDKFEMAKKYHNNNNNSNPTPPPSPTSTTVTSTTQYVSAKVPIKSEPGLQTYRCLQCRELRPKLRADQRFCANTDCEIKWNEENWWTSYSIPPPLSQEQQVEEEPLTIKKRRDENKVIQIKEMEMTDRMILCAGCGKEYEESMMIKSTMCDQYGCSRECIEFIDQAIMFI